MRTTSRIQNHSQTKRGQALIEFAMVVPLLALLLFAICQWGFIFAAYMTLRNAATIGARYAITTPNNNKPTVAQIQAFTTSAVAPMLKSASVTAVNVDQNYTSGSVTGATSVQIQYNLPLIIPFVVIGNTGTILSLQTTAIMR